MLDQITPVIITWNEQDNIARTLNRLRWARRVVVLDSFSTDATLEIAGSFPNVEVVQHAFHSFADQWNFALSHPSVASEWVMRLDADYVLSEALIDELRAVSPPQNISAYRCRFRYCVDGEPLSGTLYPTDTVIFRRRHGRFEQDGHAQRFLLTEGKYQTLSSPIDHDDRKPLGRWLAAQDRYARQEAEKLAQTPFNELGWPDRIRMVPLLAAGIVPWYCLLAKRCILDGRPGWTYVAQRTTFELILSMRLLERRTRHSK